MPPGSGTRPADRPADVLSPLTRDLRRFAETAAAASLTADTDRPPEDVPPPLDACIDAVGDLHVLAHDLVAALTADDGRDLRERLIAAHDGVNRLREPLKTATSFQSMTSLARVGQSRRREWQAWSAAMRGALQQLDEAFAPIDERLLASWKAISAAAKT